MVWFYLTYGIFPRTTLLGIQPFNPTMVWFYPSADDCIILKDFKLSIPLWSDFITKLLEKTTKELGNFQSHYGLILSYNTWEEPYAKYTAFNPTMVWFYPKTIYMMFSINYQAFNPTMVWFYHSQEDILTFWALRLSIPLWSDFIEYEKRDEMEDKKCFQSHYGLILSKIIKDIQRELQSTFNPTMVWFYLVWNRRTE